MSVIPYTFTLKRNPCKTDRLLLNIDLVKHAMDSEMCSYGSCIAQIQCKRTEIYRVTTQGPCVGCVKLGEIKDTYTLLYHISDVNTLISEACHESI